MGPSEWVLLVGVLGFQTAPLYFRLLFRRGFGRRMLTLGGAILGPLFFLAAALIARLALPRWVIYAPLQVLPPFHDSPESQALWSSSETGMVWSDLVAFGGFSALVLLAGLGHYIHLWITRWRETDPANTKFWGESWLLQMPGIGRLGARWIHVGVEPGLVLIAGYALCAVAPAFGIFLIVGSFVLWIDQRNVWKSVREHELDTRDSLVHAENAKAVHEAARRRVESREQQASAISKRTLARVQRNPHALLTLSPEETLAARAALGGDAFSELVDALPPEAQNQVYGRFVGLASADPPQARPA